MPVRFRLSLERRVSTAPWPSAYVAAYSLRGAVVPFLRDAAGLHDIHGHRYSIHQPQPSDSSAPLVHVDFCLLSDNSAPKARAALDLMRSGAQPVTIGDVPAHVAHVAVASAEPVSAAAGHGRAAQPPPAEFVDISFLSVTTFAAGNRRTRAVPDPALIIRSWSSSWNAMAGCPQQCPPEVVDDLGQHLEPVDGSLAWTVARFPRNPNPDAPNVHAPHTMFGFTGKLTLRVHHSATREAACWLSRLAWLASYAGTGYHAQIGLGATRAAARYRSAGPPERRKLPSSADGA